MTRWFQRLAIFGAFGGVLVALFVRPRHLDAIAAAVAAQPEASVADAEVADHPPRLTFARGTRRAVGFAVLGAGTALMLAILVPFVLGMRSYTVMSGSMHPAINTGDVVVERTLDPEEIRPGDVVTFRDPTRDNHLITHRVRQMSISAGRVHVITRGDANVGTERWSVPIHGHVGLVVYRLPAIGYVAHAIGGTPGRLGFVVAPIVLLGLTLLVDVWRPRRRAAGALGEVAA